MFPLDTCNLFINFGMWKQIRGTKEKENVRSINAILESLTFCMTVSEFPKFVGSVSYELKLICDSFFGNDMMCLYKDCSAAFVEEAKCDIAPKSVRTVGVMLRPLPFTKSEMESMYRGGVSTANSPDSMFHRTKSSA